MTGTEDVVLIEQHEQVRVIRLNRPEKKNALSDELGWAIVGAIEEAAHDDDVWVVAITGEGDAFCSGLDLSPSDPGASASPLSTQERRLDELGWVGRFAPVMCQVCDKPLLEYCAQLAGLAPIAARQTKQMLVQGFFQSDLRSHCRDEIAKARRGLATEDGQEAVIAIMEKRPPVFRGR